MEKNLFRYDSSSRVNSSFPKEERPVNNLHVYPLVQAFMVLDSYFFFTRSCDYLALQNVYNNKVSISMVACFFLKMKSNPEQTEVCKKKERY